MSDPLQRAATARAADGLLARRRREQQQQLQQQQKRVASPWQEPSGRMQRPTQYRPLPVTPQKKPTAPGHAPPAELLPQPPRRAPLRVTPQKKPTPPSRAPPAELLPQPPRRAPLRVTPQKKPTPPSRAPPAELLPQPPRQPPPQEVLRSGRSSTPRLITPKVLRGPNAPASPPPAELLGSQKRARPAGLSSQALMAESFPRDAPLHISLRSDAELPDLLDGLPLQALALSIEGKKKALCSQADAVLASFFDDAETGIEYSEGLQQEDNSWELYPEVGAALQEKIPNARESFCLATSRTHNVWAVGVSMNGRCRYQASRIALALSLCQQSAESGEPLDLSEVPTFRELQAVGDSTSMDDAEVYPVASASKRAKREKEREEFTKATQITHTSESSTSVFQRDTPFWISLPDDMNKSSELEGLSETALAVSSASKPRRLYSDGDALLAAVLGDAAAEVELFDDPNWSQFPEVGACLKQIADAEECFCVAVSRSYGLWAVGVGMKGPLRYGAAKVVLAATACLQQEEMNEGQDADLSGFPLFEEFLEAVRASVSVDL